MKKFIALILLFALLTFLLPFAGLLFSDKSPFDGADSEGNSQNPSSAEYKILNETTGAVDTVLVRDFLIGALASEMPLSYNDEALKAQVVAAHTYAEARKAREKSTPTAALLGADFSADPVHHKGYITKEDLQKMWGSEFKTNYAKTASVVDEVIDKLVLYKNAPALTCYFAVSCGNTEFSENVWSEPIPYLIQVDSAGDAAAEGFWQTVTFSAQNMMSLLQAGFSGLNLSSPPESWFGSPVYSAAGYVLTLPVGGAIVSGADFRSRLSLRSACFAIAYSPEKEEFTVTTKGYGHGVGMSQFGANLLAVKGKTYGEILAYYFPGTALG